MSALPLPQSSVIPAAQNLLLAARGQGIVCALTSHPPGRRRRLQHAYRPQVVYASPSATREAVSARNLLLEVRLRRVGEYRRRHQESTLSCHSSTIRFWIRIVIRSILKPQFVFIDHAIAISGSPSPFVVAVCPQALTRLQWAHTSYRLFARRCPPSSTIRRVV